MGKTRLLSGLGRHGKDVNYVRAASFIRHPKKYDTTGNPLVIDALDEVASLLPGDPLHIVLTALAELNFPDFIVSCRSADWRHISGKADIAEDYRRLPTVWRIEPISEAESRDYLIRAGVDSDVADSLIERLGLHNLSELLGNPLTLQMLASIVDASIDYLPETRAELFERAIDVLWREENDAHENSRLARMSKAEALNGAGAICASLLLTGTSAVVRSQGSLSNGTILLADVARLPNAIAADTIVDSRLFQLPNVDGEIFPIHRTVAEYLGADWIAGQVALPDGHRIASRLMSLIAVESMIPSSLRGLHAWLARSSAFTDQVVRNDPYGLLRYGDSSTLSAEQSVNLLDALERLEGENPYFRSGDWDSLATAGLQQSAALIDRIRSILRHGKAGFQLRFLILEIVRGTPLVKTLESELIQISMDEKRTYAEREMACLTLFSDNSIDTDWLPVIDEFRERGTESSTRLGIRLIEKIGARNFAPEFVGACVLAATGFGAVRRRRGAQYSSGTLWKLRDSLSDEMIPVILDTISEGLERHAAEERGAESNWENWFEISSFSRTLIKQAVMDLDPPPEKIWRWLMSFVANDYDDRADRANLVEYFRTNDQLRRSIQKFALYLDELDRRGSLFTYWLGRVSPGLLPTREDVECLIADFQKGGGNTSRDKDALRTIISMAYGYDGIVEKIRPWAVECAGDDAELLRLLDPEPSDQEKKWREQERRSDERRNVQERKKLDRWEQNRIEFEAHQAEIEAGELRWVSSLAKAYLGLFSDTLSDQPPIERIIDWVGPDIAKSAVVGFEAVLSRPEIPTALQVSQSYAEGKYWHFIHPIVAGLAEMAKRPQGLGGVDPDCIRVGWFGCMGELLDQRSGVEWLGDTLRDWLARDEVVLERSLREWFEPHLEANKEHISGLYSLVRDNVYEHLAWKLAAEWIPRFPNLTSPNISELVHALVHCPVHDRADAWNCLRCIVLDRLTRVSLTGGDDNIWAAVIFLVTFDEAVEHLSSDVLLHSDMLWEIRSIIGYDRSGQQGSTLLGARQLHWLIKMFRANWPNAHRPTGVTSGDRNAWDASQFILWAIASLAKGVDETSVGLLDDLISEDDEYQPYIRSAVFDQRRAITEQKFQSASLDDILRALEDRPPQNSAELQAVILSELESLQKRLKGNSTNTISRFYTDEGKPRTENDCRDLLIDLLRPPFGIEPIPEEQMPRGKRVDIGLRLGNLRVPLEAKGQWNGKIWRASETQLDALYTIDHQADGRGIYLVFWFGRHAPPGRRLKHPPSPLVAPEKPLEMKAMLEGLVPPGRRDSVAIFVLDLEAVASANDND